MYFTLTQKQYLILVLFGGLLMIQILVIGYWSFRLTVRKEKEEDAEGNEFPDGLREGNRPVPLFIVLLTGAVLIWGVAYVIAIALGGLDVQ